MHASFTCWVGKHYNREEVNHLARIPEKFFHVPTEQAVGFTCGAIRYAARISLNEYDFNALRILATLFPKAFYVNGLIKNLLIRGGLRQRSAEDAVREAFKMVEKKKTTWKISDETPVSPTAGDIRMAAEKFCGETGRALRGLFPAVFERTRIFPDLLPGSYMKDENNIPYIIRMREEDARWIAVSLIDGKNIGHYPIYDFEEKLVEKGFEVITKEEAFALL